jgi:hypothetical protein
VTQQSQSNYKDTGGGVSECVELLWEPLTYTKKSMEEPDVIKITANVHKKGKIKVIGDRLLSNELNSLRESA